MLIHYPNGLAKKTLVSINGVVVTWVVAIELSSTRRGFDSLLMQVQDECLFLSCSNFYQVRGMRNVLEVTQQCPVARALQDSTKTTHLCLHVVFSVYLSRVQRYPALGES